jgi:septum formation protein
MDNAPMTTHLFVYLASQSPRRAQLMDQLGVPHRPLAPDRHEDMEALEEERSNEPPNEYVRRVTILKMNAARARLRRRRLPDAPILCADTTVALGRRILHKPKNEEHAAEMLRALSGRTHRVMTAVAVSVGRQTLLEVSESRVRFGELSERSIGMYVASGEPMGKAGAYAIQSRIGAWIEHIEGSYSGIMGLPLHETTTLLSRARVRLDL